MQKKALMWKWLKPAKLNYKFTVWAICTHGVVIRYIRHGRKLNSFFVTKTDPINFLTREDWEEDCRHVRKLKEENAY